MIFYKIELKTVPKFLFCCSVSVNNYKNSFENRQNYIEICIVEKGSIVYEENSGKKEIVMPNTLTTVTSGTNCTTSAYKGEVQCHTTVGVNALYKLTKYDSSSADISRLKDDLKNEGTFLLPYHSELDEKEYKSMLGLLKKLIAYCNSYKPSDKIMAISAWYKLCAGCTDTVLKRMDNSYPSYPPSAHIYTQKIQDYIFQNYKEKISVSDISAKLGISEGYMQRLFKGITGKSIIEFANEYKIKSAIEILKIQPARLSELAEQVGVDDPSYMSRLFKKVMGISFEEYINSYR